MTAKELPSPDLLRKLLRYDDKTGKLFWRARPADMFATTADSNKWNNRFAGKEALTHKTQKGYLTGMVCACPLRAHRVVWAIDMGAWPDEMIDHINGDPSDNRIENLRSCSNAENLRNRGAQANNTSGHKGVCWSKKEKKWTANIAFGGRLMRIGCFTDYMDACEAYRLAAQKHHGDYANWSNAK